jgi:membrane protease YdiL (CAAX protease family)
MPREPLLSLYPNYLRFVFLLLVILVSFLFTLLAGLVIAIPVFGTDILKNISDLTGESLMNNVELQRYLQIVSQIGMFIIPAFLYAYFVDRHVISYIKLDHKPRLLSLILACLSILIALPFINWLVQINESFHLPHFLSGLENWMKSSEEQATKLTEAFLSDISIRGLIINIVMIGILASIGEELLFRGILVRLLNEWFRNAHLAVVISAILFSALHLQFYGFLPRMVLGILLGYLFIWTGNLWIPVLTHFLNNMLSVIVSYFYNKGSIATDVDSFGGNSNPLVIVLSVIIVIVLLLGIKRYEVSGRSSVVPRDDQNT